MRKSASRRNALVGGVAVVIGVGGLAVSALPAGAATPRNDANTLQYLVDVTAGGTVYDHAYTVTTDACGYDFTGTGQYPSTGTAQFDETMSGVIGGPPAAGVSVTYTDYYYDPSSNQATGYQYTFTGAFTDAAGDFAGTITDNAGNQNLPTTGTLEGLSRAALNHGQFVSQSGGGSTAAHNCTGLPSQSHG